MPTENEFKYVLSTDSVEDIAERAAYSHVVTQGYLGEYGSIRIRSSMGRLGRHYRFLTFKQKISNRLIEIEKEIDERDFNDLMSIATNIVCKNRYFFPKFPGLTVDYLHDKEYNLYCALAEWEVDESIKETPQLPDFIAKYVIYIPKQTDLRFSNFKLSNKDYALFALDCVKPWVKDKDNGKS